MKKSIIFVLVFVTAVLVIASCTAQLVDLKDCVTGKPAGFWMGLWHGIISPVTFIISLFTDTVKMYAVYNNGEWYDFGFVIGAGILFGGGKKAGKFRRRRDDED